MKTSNSIRVPDRARRLLGGLLLAAVPDYASAVTDADLEAVRDQLQQDWFYTEVIIFQRPAVMEFVSKEALVRSGTRGFPAGIATFLSDPANRPDAYLLEPADGCQAFEFPDAQVTAQQVTDAPELVDDDAAIDASARPIEAPDWEPGSAPVPTATPRLGPDPVVDFLAAVGEFEAELSAQNPALFAPGQLTMNGEAARIQGDRRYQVLWHGGWLQAVPARDAPAPLLLQTGHRDGERYQLEGSIDVTLGRYLHFHTRLHYQEPLLGAAPVQRPLSPTSGSNPTDLAGADRNPAIESDQSAMQPSLEPTQPVYMVMEQSRRVRSGELHYLDHPKLGVLLRISPVVVPDSLVDAYLALQEDPE